MAIVEKKGGKLPVYKGDWSETYNDGHGYMVKNRVTIFGSELESLIDNNTYVPATRNEQTGVVTFEEHWKVISNGSQAYAAALAATNKMAELEEEWDDQDQRMAQMQATINAKQLEVGAVQTDEVPTENSGNHMTSGDIYQTLKNSAKGFVDEEPTAGSDNLVKSGGIKNELALGAVYDISAKNPTAGPNNDGKFESLSALLSDANLNTLIPTSVRKGGMSIKFVCSSDNKYVQARLMANSFTTDVTQWQGVDDVPTAGSNNLVKSGGVWQIPKFLFAENCPWVKEMYITQEGLDVGIGNIHSIYSEHLVFSNTEGTNFVGITVPTGNSKINPIYYYNGSTDNTRILGYIIVDWANIPLFRPSVNRINDIAKNLLYSPSIAQMFLAKSINPTVQELGYNVDKNISQKTITENLDAIFTKLIGYKQEAVATTNPPLSANTTSFIWFIIPNQRLSKINKIKFLAKKGTVNFYKVKYDGVNAPTKEDITSVVVNSLQESSVITIDVDVNLASDEYIGVNGAFWFGEITGNTTRYWDLSTDKVSGKTTQYLFVNAYYEDINSEIAEIKEQISDNSNKVVMYSSELNSENPDIVGTQLIVDGALRVGSSLLYLNKFYSLGIRTFRAICKFNADTIANFVTVYFNTHTTGGYTNNIIINISQRTIVCGSGKTVYCPLLVNYNHEFIIDITKYFQHNAVKITDLYSGAEWEYVWTFNGTGGTRGGAIGTLLDTGMAWDLYGFYTSGGTFDIKKIVVLGKKADVVFYGDSITEPEAYWPHNIFNKSWTQLLYKKSNGRIVSSGRSGTTINSLLGRMQAELPYLKPKAVFITIGTNGGVSYSSLETIVNYIKSLDIVPYVNHIPANINSGGVSNHAGVNAIVDQIRTQMNVKGIDFDKPTSIDYAGGNVNTAMMWWEEHASPDGNIYHHPNELGSAAMVARVEADVPEIYSI